jgi:hypothetical protein
VDEYLLLTVKSQTGEAEDRFNGRLIAFWSHFLRTRPAEYQRVYAETTRFEAVGDRVTRQYLVAADVVDVVTEHLAAAGVAHEPLDRDDLYSKYEATPPQWFQIPH